MPTNIDVSSVPILSSKTHSGAPLRLLREAKRAKALLYSNKTTIDHQSRTGELPRLPPGVDRATFNRAITQLRLLIGSDNVEINDKPLNDGWYLEHPNTHDAFHIIDQEEMVCSTAVYPGNTEDVQSIVKWANQYLIPVYPVSMGRNVGYGGTAPRVPGSVVIDLGRRMNKVLKIDGLNASCVVEPGVSYFQLYEEVQASGVKCWIDTPDIGGGSVLGNAIDRGVGYTPMGDHFGNHCGMEVVLPSGDVLRTGMGALPGENGQDNPTWQSFQQAYGPYNDGIFSQSNYGVVTKMGFWLMREVEHQSYMVTFPRDDDFEKLVDIIRPLALNRVLGNIPQIRHVIQELAVTGKPKSAWWDGTGRVPREIVAKHASTLPCGDVAWVFYGCQYGDKTSMASQFEVIRAEFGKISGSKFYFPADMPGDHYLHDRAKVNAGIPILRELDWLNWVPNAAHLFFSPITPTDGKNARVVFDIANRLHEKYDFDIFPTFCVAGREMHFIVNIVYNRADDDAKYRALCLMTDMIQATAQKGYGEYRTHILFADQVAATYSWNNNALMRFNETIKDAVDPNGILAPGRNGIWPRRFRGRGWELTGEEPLKPGSSIGPKL